MGQAQGLVRKDKMAERPKGQNSDSDSAMTLPIPWDTVLHILSFVPGRDLILNCRRVNSVWRDAVDNCHLWIMKMDREEVVYPPMKMMMDDGMDWKKIYILRPFGRNLLKNWDGAGAFNHWQVTSNGGHRFKLEPADHPSGSKPLPSELGCKNCWATSFGACSKEQIVDLVANGCDPAWLDKKQPPIEVSEWVANRFDCAAKYRLTVTLCDDSLLTPIHKKECMFVHERLKEQWADNSWEKISHVFTNYGPGLRRIHFAHLGVDGQFWAGHYGSKMAGPCVKVLLPES